MLVCVRARERVLVRLPVWVDVVSCMYARTQTRLLWSPPHCCTVALLHRAIVALSALGVEERTGRAGGFDERNDPKDKKHYDSDEEEYDDFGRKKKKKKRG